MHVNTDFWNSISKRTICVSAVIFWIRVPKPVCMSIVSFDNRIQKTRLRNVWENWSENNMCFNSDVLISNPKKQDYDTFRKIGMKNYTCSNFDVRIQSPTAICLLILTLLNFNSKNGMIWIGFQKSCWLQVSKTYRTIDLRFSENDPKLQIVKNTVGGPRMFLVSRFYKNKQ